MVNHKSTRPRLTQRTTNSVNQYKSNRKPITQAVIDKLGKAKLAKHCRRQRETVVEKQTYYRGQFKKLSDDNIYQMLSDAVTR